MNNRGTMVIRVLCLLLVATCGVDVWPQNALVLQSDFGTEDGAVAAMKGVAYGVSKDLHIFDLTHEIPPFDIWQAAYRLLQTAEYWPEGTVFVSVVDPGVGTTRKSVVLKTKSRHFFVTPDNGTLTLVADRLGIAEVREIDEAVNRLAKSERSHTFHGRDVYAFTGARLAAKKILFEQVGPKQGPEIVAIAYQQATFDDGIVRGTIPILDVRYGNVWTNVPPEVFTRLGLVVGDSVAVSISFQGKRAFSGNLLYATTFGDVPPDKPLLYLNSLGKVAVAINLGNFAQTYKIASGPEWRIEMKAASEANGH